MSPTAPSRIGAGCAVAAVVALMVLTSAGEESDSAVILGGEVLALLLFVPFLAYLFSVLRSTERRAEWLPVTVLAAGLLAIAVKVVSMVPVIALRRGGIDPSLHAALQEMADAAFIVSLPALGICLGAVAAVVLRNGALPAWLGWFAAVTAPLLVANGFAVGGDEGPAFVLFMLWTLVTGIVLLRRAVMASRRSVAVTGRAVPS
jgi:hypothetical protein